MNISLHFAAGAALVLLLSGHAYAGQATPASSQGEGRTLQADQAGSADRAATAPSGSSVVERDRKRYENQKRAADKRAAQLKRANKAGKPAAGSSVVERDQKRYENQKRAAEQRAAEIRKTEMAEQKRDARQQKPADVQGQAPAAK